MSETSGCLPWKQNRISFEGFCVLYAEARHHALAGREDEGGLLAATAGYVRGGLERVAGEELLLCIHGRLVYGRLVLYV